MQAQLHRRFADGLSLNVNYTLARGKSDNENSSFTPAVQALPYSSRNYALISTDRLNNLGITSSWELPFGPERRWLHDGGVLSYIVGGWQVNNTFSMISGPPFSVFADDTSLNLPGSSQTADQVKPVVKLGGVGSGTRTTIPRRSPR